MDIKIREPLSDELREILRNRTTLLDREAVASRHKMHRMTIEKKIRRKEPAKIMRELDRDMIIDLCRVAFQNNKDLKKECEEYDEKLGG